MNACRYFKTRALEQIDFSPNAKEEVDQWKVQ
jgi:hypothetical protein